jgi:hypothetical protein
MNLTIRSVVSVLLKKIELHPQRLWRLAQFVSSSDVKAGSSSPSSLTENGRSKFTTKILITLTESACPSALSLAIQFSNTTSSSARSSHCSMSNAEDLAIEAVRSGRAFSRFFFKRL